MLLSWLSKASEEKVSGKWIISFYPFSSASSCWWSCSHSCRIFQFFKTPFSLQDATITVIIFTVQLFIIYSTKLFMLMHCKRYLISITLLSYTKFYCVYPAGDSTYNTTYLGPKGAKENNIETNDTLNVIRLEKRRKNKHLATRVVM